MLSSAKILLALLILGRFLRSLGVKFCKKLNSLFKVVRHCCTLLISLLVSTLLILLFSSILVLVVYDCVFGFYLIWGVVPPEHCRGGKINNSHRLFLPRGPAPVRCSRSHIHRSPRAPARVHRCRPRHRRARHNAR